jgi:hypothetical protein
MRERVMRPTKHYVIEYLCFQRWCITASLMDNSFQFVIYQRTIIIIVIITCCMMMELILINIHVCLSLDASLGALKFAGHTHTDIIIGTNLPAHQTLTKLSLNRTGINSIS